jgi:hypothetical protein
MYTDSATSIAQALQLLVNINMYQAAFLLILTTLAPTLSLSK